MIISLSFPARSVAYLGASAEDLSRFPAEVKQTIGFAIFQSQMRRAHPAIKPFPGGEEAFKGAGVVEVIDTDDGETYHAVYIAKFPDAVYVLQAFATKTGHGASVPQQSEIERIKAMLGSVREPLSDISEDSLIEQGYM